MVKNMKNTDYKKYLYAGTIIFILAAILIIFLYAPVPINPGERGTYTDPEGQVRYVSTDAQWANYVYSFYIAYFHIAIALTSYMAFLLVMIFSILYLRDGEQKWDLKAVASAEVGVIFAGLTLISGSICIRHYRFYQRPYQFHEHQDMVCCPSSDCAGSGRRWNYRKCNNNPYAPEYGRIFPVLYFIDNLQN
jgi:hypothetical protein